MAHTISRTSSTSSKSSLTTISSFSSANSITNPNLALQKENLKLTAENSQLKLKLLEFQENSEEMARKLIFELEEKNRLIEGIYGEMDRLFVENRDLMGKIEEIMRTEKQSEFQSEIKYQSDVDFEIIDEVSLADEVEIDEVEHFEIETSLFDEYPLEAQSYDQSVSGQYQDFNIPPPKYDDMFKIEATSTSESESVCESFPRQSTKTDLATSSFNINSQMASKIFSNESECGEKSFEEIYRNLKRSEVIEVKGGEELEDTKKSDIESKKTFNGAFAYVFDFVENNFNF